MDEHLKPRVLILNAGTPVASAIARRYAAEGWAISLELLDDDLAGNDLVVEVWDAGGRVDVRCAGARSPRDMSARPSCRERYDHVVDALEG